MFGARATENPFLAYFMNNKLIFFCDYKDLKNKRYLIKFFEDLKDELIIFLDQNDNIKIFSSICPHFGGEIYYFKTKDILKCKWHDWKFSAETGKCLSYPIEGKLNPYDFEVTPNNLTEHQYKEIGEKIYLSYEK